MPKSMMALNQQDAFKTEKVKDKRGHLRTYYWFVCTDCPQKIRVRSDALQRDCNKCTSCSHKKRPFESLYNQLHNDWRGIKVTLSYEEYIEFTNCIHCVYCNAFIDWQPYGIIRGKFLSRSYYLDRKDSHGPYSKENCVVCCTRCNKMKSAEYSFEEFLILGRALKEIYCLRMNLSQPGRNLN